MVWGSTLRAAAVCRRPAIGLHILTSTSRNCSVFSNIPSKRSREESVVITIAPLRSGFQYRNLQTSLMQPNKQTNETGQTPTKKNEKDQSDGRSLFQRFKDDFSRYWYIMLPIHISTSFGYFLCFYYLSKAGVNPAPLMDLLGVPAQYVDPIRTSTASHVAVGYAGYKIIAPLRYITTIAVTRLTVQSLSTRGILKPMPTFAEFKLRIKAKFKSITSK